MAVGHDPLPNSSYGQLAELYNKYYAKDFPNTIDQPKLISGIPNLGVPQMAALFEKNSVPTPRLWCIGEDEAYLVQLQDDWYARNWRGFPIEAEYPNFRKLAPLFKDGLQHLTEYFESKEAAFIPRSCEITYINHIPKPTDWNTLGEIEKVFTVWNMPEESIEFPGQPDQVTFESVYPLKAANGEQCGHLIITAQSAAKLETGEELISLTLSARGVPLSADNKGIIDFMNLGHEWIVKSFNNIITDEARKKWGELDGDEDYK